MLFFKRCRFFSTEKQQIYLKKYHYIFLVCMAKIGKLIKEKYTLIFNASIDFFMTYKYFL